MGPLPRRDERHERACIEADLKRLRDAHDPAEHPAAREPWDTDAAANACFWGERDGFWQTECDERPAFVFDGPLTAGFNYCPFCGGKMVVVED